MMKPAGSVMLGGDVSPMAATSKDGTLIASRRAKSLDHRSGWRRMRLATHNDDAPSLSSSNWAACRRRNRWGARQESPRQGWWIPLPAVTCFSAGRSGVAARASLKPLSLVFGKQRDSREGANSYRQVLASKPDARKVLGFRDR